MWLEIELRLGKQVETRRVGENIRGPGFSVYPADSSQDCSVAFPEHMRGYATMSARRVPDMNSNPLICYLFSCLPF